MRVALRWLIMPMLFCQPAFTQVHTAEIQLCADHFSRTITAVDSANYLIEAVAKGHEPMPVKLAMLPNDALGFKLSTDQITTPALFRLKVSAKQTGDYKISIVAAAETMKDTLQVWLHVVNATSENPLLIFDAPPGGKLEKNLMQSLEGAIVPAQTGSVTARLRPLNSRKDTVVTVEVDKEGLFHVNHLFAVHGDWQADATFIPSPRSQSYQQRAVSSANKSILFQVNRSPFRLTVAAEESFRYQKRPEILRVFGQMTPDYVDAGTKIKIQVTYPDNKKDSTEVPPDANGKFNANFPATEQGIYRIEAIANISNLSMIPNSFGSTDKASVEQLYASVAPASFDLGANSHTSPLALPPTNSAFSTIPTFDVPAGYAVIVVGNNTEYLSHLNMAYHVRDALISNRAFLSDHILLITLAGDTPPPASSMVTPMATPSTLGTTITNFLLTQIPHQGQPGNPKFGSHQGILFFWIGETDANGNFVALNDANATTPATLLSPTQVRGIYDTVLNASLVPPSGTGSKPLWKYFNGVVIIHAGDRSGRLLNSLTSVTSPEFLNGAATSAPPLPLGIASLPVSPPASANELESFWELCGLKTFAGRFLYSLPTPSAIIEKNVKQVFRDARNGLSDAKLPAINEGMGITYTEPISPTFGNEPGAQIFLGYNKSRSDLIAQANVQIAASVVCKPQVGAQGTVYVSFDNPNNYLIRDVMLFIHPPEGQEQPMVCYEVQPVDRNRLWKTRVNFNVSGSHHIEVFSRQETPNGHLETDITAFERVRFDTTTVIPPPNGGTSVFFDPRVEAGFNYGRGFDPGSVRDSQNKPSGVIDVNFYSTAGGHLEFLGLGVASNFDRFWGMLMPMSVSAGGTKALPNLWIYSGFGYELGNAKFIKQDLLYFVGLKYRLLSLKH